MGRPPQGPPLTWPNTKGKGQKEAERERMVRPERRLRQRGWAGWVKNLKDNGDKCLLWLSTGFRV